MCAASRFYCTCFKFFVLLFIPRSNHTLWMVCLEPRCGINQIVCDEYFALVPITCSYTCRQKSASAIVIHSGLLMRALYSTSSCCTASFSSCKPWAKTPWGTVTVAGSSANHGLWHICWASVHVRVCVCVCVWLSEYTVSVCHHPLIPLRACVSQPQMNV